MEEMFEKCAPLINLGNEIAVILKTQPLSSLLVIGCNQSLELWNKSENKMMTLHVCEVLNSMSSKMLELNLMIVKMVFESFGMEKYYELHTENNSGTLRMIKYKVVPPITDSPTVGVPSHTEKFLDHFVSK